MKKLKLKINSVDHDMVEMWDTGKITYLACVCHMDHFLSEEDGGDSIYNELKEHGEVDVKMVVA